MGRSEPGLRAQVGVAAPVATGRATRSIRRREGRDVMSACVMKPGDRRRQVRLVGNDLVEHYGKKNFYGVQEVKDANRRQGIDADFWCWSHATFNSHGDFDTYHESIGESCDYVAMKSEMLAAVGTQADASWFDFDLSWLEFPDIDWSIFDFFDL
jgi:hypothetical protein